MEPPGLLDGQAQIARERRGDPLRAAAARAVGPQEQDAPDGAGGIAQRRAQQARTSAPTPAGGRVPQAAQRHAARGLVEPRGEPGGERRATPCAHDHVDGATRPRGEAQRAGRRARVRDQAAQRAREARLGRGAPAQRGQEIGNEPADPHRLG
jgi:hypothetical protein